MTEPKFLTTKEAVRRNDPPIEVNQIWVGYGDDGRVLRKLRIVAKHPDSGWIFQELPSSMHKSASSHELRVCPEFNLRYVFLLSEETWKA